MGVRWEVAGSEVSFLVWKFGFSFKGQELCVVN